MKKQHGSFHLISLSVVLAVCLVPGTVAAESIAWDLVSGTDNNLVSYSTDAPVFSSPGDGFQKFTVGLSTSIPFSLVDDSVSVFPPDTLGVIDSSSDFDEFFGVTDTVNGDTSGPLTATWVFDIGTAVPPVEVRVNLAGMGDYEVEDSFVWTWSVDGSAPVPIFNAAAFIGGTQDYMMAGGAPVTLDDPMLVDGITLIQSFQTFSASVSPGSQLTLRLTAETDGSEAYVVRNIVINDGTGAPAGGGEPIPTMSSMGIAAMVLMLMAGGVFLVRRLH